MKLAPQKPVEETVRETVNVYSYIVSSDSGFAPNPFEEYCTLACCKPVIRRTASPGDWIIGLAPKRLGNGIVFAMKITENMTMGDYWNDKRFRNKRAKMKSSNPVRRRGDNVYQPLKNGEFHQKNSRHSNKDGSENQKQKIHDLNGKNVLISDNFTYFGGKPKKLPDEFKEIIVSRGHKRFEIDLVEVSKRSGGMVGRLIRYIDKLPKGIQNNPRSWPETGKQSSRSSCS